jgi:hypothetical protein
MDWDVIALETLSDYRILVELKDGRKGIFDVKPYLNHGIFRELQNPSYFSQATILLGAVTWPHEQDIAPETLLAELSPVTHKPNTRFDADPTATL